jgi:hypothetical protein
VLKIDVKNSLEETSTVMRHVASRTVTTFDPATGEESTTIHIENVPAKDALDMLHEIEGAECKFRQTFASGYIDAFLSKLEANKTVTLRLSEETPMVMSYAHGINVIAQLLIAPMTDD